MHPLLTHLLHGMDNVLLMGRLRLIRLITRRNQTDPREIKLFLPFIPPLLFAHCCSFLGRMLNYFNHRGAPPPTPHPHSPSAAAAVICATSEQASRFFATSLPVSAQRAKQIRWGGSVGGCLGEGWWEGSMHNVWACGTSRWQALSNYLSRAPISM